MTSETVSARAMTAVWAAALAAAAALMLAILTLGGTLPADSVASRPEDMFAKSEPFAVFVGTSLFEHAIPSTLPAAQIFPNAPASDRAIRLLLNTRSETEALQVLNGAIDAGVPRIFVEANPFLMDFRLDTGLAADMRTVLSNFSNRMRAAVWTIFGVRGSAGDEPDLTRVFAGKVDALKYNQLPQLHLPRLSDELTAALRHAQTKGTDVTFILMPRSETAARYLGAKFEAELSDTAAEFSRRFGAKLWIPAASWPDDNFIDQAHPNAKGRERFLRTFREYEAANR